jgi:hypothetical protein
MDHLFYNLMIFEFLGIGAMVLGIAAIMCFLLGLGEKSHEKFIEGIRRKYL